MTTQRFAQAETAEFATRIRVVPKPAAVAALVDGGWFDGSTHEAASEPEPQTPDEWMADCLFECYNY